ncbi:HPr kinase/phosphorylase [Brevundimonas faecalis]|uniref:HPr kinase/phosphorylase n=1 Tax=Brevundimonas faecalis TaxID=947378 RepID=UPI0036200DEE
MTPLLQPVHATTVARRMKDGWRGVLITGPSGAGKSDLALRMMGDGWRLVADDWTCLWSSGDALYATAPTTIAGRIEARGLGIVSVPVRFSARVALAVECTREAIERLPEPAFLEHDGQRIPLLRIDPRPASAGQVVARAVCGL